jgi:hypothetical protein
MVTAEADSKAGRRTGWDGYDVQLVPIGGSKLMLDA